MSDVIQRLVDGLRQAPTYEYCFANVQHWSTCMTKAEWSGWVQAIGSIVAILAAVWVVRRQHGNEIRRAEWERLVEDLNRVNSAQSHYNAARVVVRHVLPDLRRAYRSGKVPWVDERGLAACTEVIKAVLPMQTSAVEVGALLGALQALQFLRDGLDFCRPEVGFKDNKNLLQINKGVAKSMWGARSGLQRKRLELKEKIANARK